MMHYAKCLACHRHSQNSNCESSIKLMVVLELILAFPGVVYDVLTMK